MYLLYYFYIGKKWWCIRKWTVAHYNYYIVCQVIKHVFHGFLGNINQLSLGMGKALGNCCLGLWPRATVSYGFSPYLGTTVWLFPSKPWNNSILLWCLFIQDWTDLAFYALELYFKETTQRQNKIMYWWTMNNVTINTPNFHE